VIEQRTPERPRVALTDHQHEGNGRRLVLELDAASAGQHDRWVLVRTLQRRLLLDAMSLRAAIAQAQAKGWLEVDGAKRVRLLDQGRALIGGHQRHRRSAMPERSKHKRRAVRRRRSHDMSMKRHW